MEAPPRWAATYPLGRSAQQRPETQTERGQREAKDRAQKRVPAACTCLRLPALRLHLPTACALAIIVALQVAEVAAGAARSTCHPGPRMLKIPWRACSSWGWSLRVGFVPHQLTGSRVCQYPDIRFSISEGPCATFEASDALGSWILHLANIK